MTGAQLKRWRERVGISQGELARILDMHQPHISNMECGKKPISVVIQLALEWIEYRNNSNDVFKND